MNRDVKILSRRLYSPGLKNVGWIEDAQLIFLIFHTLACNVFPAPPLLPCQIYRQVCGKLEKLIERVLAKLHPLNLVASVVMEIKRKRIRWLGHLLIINLSRIPNAPVKVNPDPPPPTPGHVGL